MVKIQSNFEGKCCKCGVHYARGSKIGYDSKGARGKKAYCLDCAGTALFVPDATEAEIASIRQQIDAKEEQEEPKAAPVAIPTPAGDLASLIAAAVAPLVNGKLDEARVRQMMGEFMTPPVHTITVKSPDKPEGVDLGRQHKQFETLLKICNARTASGRLNVWIAGSAGTGKTTAAENVARALGLPYACTGSLVESYKLFGFISPGTGNYVTTPFRQMWELGGMFIFDDFDGSDPAMAVELNNALANSSCTFPDGVVKRHPDCILVLTANTWGLGGTNEYVGRLKQDAAFLDRFVRMAWEIDEMLELDTCPIRTWAVRVQQVRHSVQTKGLRVLVTPRASYYGAALLQAGLTQPEVETLVLKGAMTSEQWSSVC